jgi:hypothetical protein
MDIEPSFIQHTLEQQRLQSVEDDRWLQEQEQIAVSKILVHLYSFLVSAGRVWNTAEQF